MSLTICVAPDLYEVFSCEKDGVSFKKERVGITASIDSVTIFKLLTYIIHAEKKIAGWLSLISLLINN